MDAAKGIGVQATHEGDIMDYSRRVGKPVQDIIPPLIAIPTTAGTGSEVTWVSVLVDPGEKVKIVVPSPNLAAKVAVVDRNCSLGAGGIFAQEIRSELCNLEKRPDVYSYIAGLGGRDVSLKVLEGICRQTLDNDAPSHGSVWVDCQRTEDRKRTTSR